MRSAPPLVLGIGASSGVSVSAVLSALLGAETLLGPEEFRAVATLDRRAEEPGLVAALRQYGARARRGEPPLWCLTAADLAGVAVPNPSSAVGDAVGTPSVAEAAALAVARYLGAGVGRLVLTKRVFSGVTVAAAEAGAPS
ncbi:cobalamin biosynthesis protein [Actinopolyspora mortivallis]|uniref:cobalamin biosynthesis protein n=1 Tax=Actinopolyspora mortivallis TaxID=33906 RepID=UPI000365242F|nr:cobalamin biosynthesis protein [Actinopolyspora mortivallis]